MGETGRTRTDRADRPDLGAAIRQVRMDLAERDDVVVELRDAQRVRLELLHDELAPVLADVPADDDRFDLALSAGERPRLWIDAVSHVVMGRDRRTYRFLRDTRLGRVVLCESPDMGTVAAQVTRYVAERVVERARVMEGDLDAAALFAARRPEQAPRLAPPAQQPSPEEPTRQAAPPAPAPTPAPRQSRAPRVALEVLKGIGVLLLGTLFGALFIAAIAWQRVAAYLGIGG